MTKNLVVPADNPSMRVDVFISEISHIMTRNQLKSRNAHVFVNGKEVKFSRHVIPGDEISLDYTKAPDQNIRPEKTALDIIFENESVIVVNKPRGMVVHPANGHYSGTLAQGIAWYLNQDINATNQYRTGIVHRLDKDTSGVIITAKTIEAHEFLSAQFKQKKCHKMYLAIVKGHLPLGKGQIDNYLERDRNHRKRFSVSDKGKRARTSYRVLRVFSDYSFVALYPHTGRTHQLRVHMKHIGHPIAGDPVYGRKDSSYPLLLHAYKLVITVPGSNALSVFRAPLPEDFKNAIVELSAL
ncbi:MAG: RluA family pseudouridine synthase [Spirochaetales bacterium]|nr:RluA family pseudouridine synthase [Spirochaetales bacterium]